MRTIGGSLTLSVTLDVEAILCCDVWGRDLRGDKSERRGGLVMHTVVSGICFVGGPSVTRAAVIYCVRKG